MNREFEKQLIDVRRKIHEFPELGNEEVKTTAFLEKKLKEAGIQTRRITKTGLTAVIKGEKPSSDKKNKTFALRADIDALPIQEKTNKPYSSKNNGVMHACGHDANCTMVLGSALLLNKQRKEFSGEARFIFQPNEESSGGAIDMINAGVLKNPQPQAIVGIHVSPWLPTGVLGLKSKEMMAAVDRFTIEIIGEGGHGAYPHLSKDAIVTASHVIIALQSLVSREINPTDSAVLTIGVINGGERFNIICGNVKIVGTVRTLNEDLRKFIKKQIEKKVKCITSAFGAKFKINYEALGNALINNNEILELCKNTGIKILGEKNIKALEKPSMGGEDFAEYLQHIPGCFLYIGARKKEFYPWHHEKFDIDEAVLLKGAQLLSAIAQSFLK